jgi:ankyrin repeat protein
MDTIDLNCADNDGQTPQSQAARKGHRAIVKLLGSYCL